MVYGVQTGLLSLLGLFAKAFVIDDVLESINMCKAFTVITTEAKAINEYITKNLGHSATSYDALGAYTGENRTVILTVCRRAEAGSSEEGLKKLIPTHLLLSPTQAKLWERASVINKKESAT